MGFFAHKGNYVFDGCEKKDFYHSDSNFGSRVSTKGILIPPFFRYDYSISDFFNEHTMVKTTQLLTITSQHRICLLVTVEFSNSFVIPGATVRGVDECMES